MTALSKMFSLLRKRSGSMILGRQIAIEEPFVMRGEQAAFNTFIGKEQYLHTGDSFMKLLDEVEGQTGVRCARRVEVYTYRDNGLSPTGWNRRIRFTLELLDSENFITA